MYCYFPRSAVRVPCARDISNILINLHCHTLIVRNIRNIEENIDCSTTPDTHIIVQRSDVVNCDLRALLHTTQSSSSYIIVCWV